MAGAIRDVIMMHSPAVESILRGVSRSEENNKHNDQELWSIYYSGRSRCDDEDKHDQDVPVQKILIEKTRSSSC
jgi:hypothetical protein